jgi:hypothetical protein
VSVRPSLAPEFVSFHADRPLGGAGAHPHTNLESGGYMRMLELLYRSARLWHPGAGGTLLTTPDTVISRVPKWVRRVDREVDHAALMFSRSESQLDYVERADFARPLVLLDSDILLNGDLAGLFADDFDVALTWRDNAAMPINGGLLLLHNRRPAAARAFFRRFVEVYRARFGSGDEAAWYGDQLALRDVVGLDAAAMRQNDRIEVDGVKVRLLPCETYNHSPDNTLSAIVDGLPGRLVLHWKGQRKRLMEPFWNAFLAGRESRLPWRVWRSKRAQCDLRAAAAAEQAALAAAKKSAKAGKSAARADAAPTAEALPRAEPRSSPRAGGTP